MKHTRLIVLAAAFAAVATVNPTAIQTANPPARRRRR